LYGVEIALYWNASILEMVNADVRLGVEDHPDGVLHNLSDAKISIYSNKIFQEQGKYVLAASSISPAPSFNGSGNIVRVTFNVTGVGSCDLSLEAKLASNIIPPGSTTVAPITHTTINGFFVNEPEQPPWLYIGVLVAIVIVVMVTLLMHRRRSQK
ncbi:MAG: hypothetical protein ACP5ER_05620, partial [Candidatus Bathyarchaeales archaeon]